MCRRLMLMVMLVCAGPVTYAQTGGMSLFDGRTTNGWEPRGTAVWNVVDGLLVPSGGRGMLATREPYANFRLRVEFWIDNVANSGVFLRCPAAGEITQGNAIEVNIFDAHEQWPTGSVNEFAKIATTPKTVGQWNTYEIVAIGDHVTVTLNGERTADTKHTRSGSGPIALQYNGSGVVRFRSVTLQRLE